MAKLHEILAVESSLEKAANKLINESVKTLSKEALFSGMHRELHMFREEDKNSELSDTQVVTTTVDENLDYTNEPVAKWIDVVLQKDLANQEARADLEIDGKVVASNLPASFLLGLETKLQKYRVLLESVGTLPPGRVWKPADDYDRPGVYVDANQGVQLKTRRDPEFRVVAEATPEHPAQVKEVERVLDVGRYVTTVYSGKISPADKAARLTRLDKLLRAVKQARMRANNIDVKKAEVGTKILDYINRGELR